MHRQTPPPPPSGPGLVPRLLQDQALFIMMSFTVAGQAWREYTLLEYDRGGSSCSCGQKVDLHPNGVHSLANVGYSAACILPQYTETHRWGVCSTWDMEGTSCIWDFAG